MNRFEGLTAVVTGAGHGIGRETALRLGAEGASVAVLSLHPEETAETVASIEAAGGVAAGWAVDVADEAAIAVAAAESAERLGPADVLVNNAGLLIPGSALEVSLETWDRTFSVNVRGMLLVTRAFLPAMVERERGSIVNVASTGGLFGVPRLAAYNASKGAVVNATRNLAADYGCAGVRVNCVCPGWVDTGFNDPMIEGVSATDLADTVRDSVPLGRQSAPEEIAAAICFLASEEASYISGHALVIDGGLTARL